MDRLDRAYLPDGTPLEHIRQLAKKITKERKCALHQAQADEARERGYESWEQMVASCWGEPSLEEDYDPDYACLIRKVGADLIWLDFDELIDLDLSGAETIYGASQVCYISETEVRYHTDLQVDHLGGLGTVEALCVLNERSRQTLQAALRLYEDDGHVGSLVRALSGIGILSHSELTSGKEGEFEAYLVLKLREKKRFLGERHLLNIFDPGVEDQRPRTDVPARRAFVHKVKDGSYTVCNGCNNASDFQYRLLSAGEWLQYEDELWRNFPDGPQKTFASEVWLSEKMGFSA